MVMRSGRVNPQYQGKNILKAMSYHVACWAVEERGVKSIVSMEREKSPLQETKPGRYKNIKHTWVRHFFYLKLSKSSEPFLDKFLKFNIRKEISRLFTKLNIGFSGNQGDITW